MKRKLDRIWETPRVIHRRAYITTTGTAGSATGSAFLAMPPGRVTHLKIDYDAAAPATTDVVLTRDDAAGAGTAFFTRDDSATDLAIRALGSPAAVDEGRAVTAATDATDGGAFIKNGIYVDVHDCDAITNAVILDIWYEVLRLETLSLISQSGVDGSAVVTRTLPLNGAGRLIGLQVDFQNTPATADLTIYADSSAGETLFTSTSSQTDFGPAALGIIGVDEATNALAATDGSCGGAPFRQGLYFDVAQSDAYTQSNEVIVVYCWIKQ